MAESIQVREIAEIVDLDAEAKAMQRRIEEETRPCITRRMTAAERALYQQPERAKALMARYPRETVLAALREAGSVAGAARQLHLATPRLRALMTVYGIQLGKGNPVRRVLGIQAPPQRASALADLVNALRHICESDEGLGLTVEEETLAAALRRLIRDEIDSDMEAADAAVGDLVKELAEMRKHIETVEQHLIETVEELRNHQHQMMWTSPPIGAGVSR